MQPKHIYAISWLIISAVVDLLIDLLAAAIQQRAFPAPLSNLAICILAGLTLVGLLISYWLGGTIKIPVSPTSKSAHTERLETVTITRLRAIFSYSKLKGKGIHLSNILLIGSKMDIET